MRTMRGAWSIALLVAVLLGIARGPAPTYAIPTTLDLDGDTDNDGKLGETEVERESDEKAEEDKQAILVICNCDAEPGPDKEEDPQDSDGADTKDVILPADMDDEQIGSDEDREDLASIVIRKAGGLEVGSVTLKLMEDSSLPAWLEVDKEKMPPVRVFGPDDKPILGPGKSLSYTLSPDDHKALAIDDLTFLVEGLHFGIGAKLDLELADSGVQDSLLIRVAPFVAVHHALEPKDIYCQEVVPEPGTTTFPEALKAAAVATGVEQLPTTDCWIQDAFLPGFTQLPSGEPMPVLLLMERYRGETRARVEALRRPGLGVWAHPSRLGSDDTMGYAGNILVAPPPASDASSFGRICYGSLATQNPPPPPSDQEAGLPDPVVQSRAIHEDWQTFFEAQAVQAPIDFRTDWLKVGHLDEVLSFVPAKTARGWIAVLASPRLGLELIQNQSKSYELACCFQRSFQYRYVFQLYARKTLGMGLLAYNEEVARRILGPDPDQAQSSEPDETSVKGILMKHLGLSEDEIVELPVLFINDEEAPINTWAARALTPNVVNMAVVGSRCLVPDPVIPAFRAATEIPGCDVQFIPAWSPFHELGGGIHCATQVVRELPGGTQR